MYTFIRVSINFEEAFLTFQPSASSVGRQTNDLPYSLQTHLGTSRGGRTTKIHALSDDCGRPVAFALTPGNAHDLAGAKALLAIRCPSHKLLADRAYDAASLRDWRAERGTEPVIPPNPTRKNPHADDRDAYRGRNLIERMFCRLKDFRRIATRYDKRADIFLSAVCIAATITSWTDN